MKTHTFTTTYLLLALCFASITSFSQVFTPQALHSSVNHVQPMTGIVFWADNTSNLKTLGNKTQLEFAYLIYSDVIEQDGVYNWTSVDNLLNTAKSRGRQVILRFRYTYPGETKRSVPLYITQKSGYTTHILKVEGQNTFIPDWTSQDLQDFTLQFYTKFAERYDNDPRLAFVQVGFGSYSEYHLYDGPSNPVGKYFPSKAFQTTFLNHANGAFKNTQWSISIDAAESDYSPMSANTALKNLNFGLFDDSFLHEEHSKTNNEYNRASWLFFGANRSDKSVAGGELNYYSTYDQQHVLDAVGGPWGTTYESLSDMYNISYMIGNDQLKYQTAARIEAASMANGYHYAVTKYESNGTTTNVTIKNTGIAPIYYDAYPTINAIRSTESLKGLIAGASKTFSIPTKAIGEDLKISCDRLVSGQEIQFDANLEGVISALDNSTATLNLSTYPNPATTIITINGWTEGLTWRLVNNTATEVMTGNTKEINTTNLKAGSFSILFSNGKKTPIIKIE